MTTTINSRSGEKGFTLVELSIVMIIIGLLIGGILKGQELIANARLASSISRVKAIDAAINTFRDSYSGLPGDIAAARLPNCTGECAIIPAASAGLGNNRIGANDSAGVAQGPATENIAAWAQLAAVDLIGGVRNSTITTAVISGQHVPEAEIPGQIFIGYQLGGNTNLTSFPGPATSVRSGHYLLIHTGTTGGSGLTASLPASGAGGGTATLTPVQASRFDTKLDDATPNNGSVLAMGVAATGVTGCVDAATTAAVYNLNNEAPLCGVYIRVQN